MKIKELKETNRVINDSGMKIQRKKVEHKDDGQTKFIKLNSQRQDIIIKYWVSIGSIHREQG